MSRMIRKCLSILMVMAMALTICPAAFAGELAMELEAGYAAQHETTGQDSMGAGDVAADGAFAGGVDVAGGAGQAGAADMAGVPGAGEAGESAVDTADAADTAGMPEGDAADAAGMPEGDPDASEEETDESIFPDELIVGHPTITKGDFFTEMFGNDTADIDVRALIHGYNLVNWDQNQGVYKLDPTIVTDVEVEDDEVGNRTYYLELADDLFFSDGTRITAWDYAFSLLLLMAPEIEQIGGKIYRAQHILGYKEYIQKEEPTLKGVRVIKIERPGEDETLVDAVEKAQENPVEGEPEYGNDASMYIRNDEEGTDEAATDTDEYTGNGIEYILTITLDHDFLPYFFETGLLLCVPYPIYEIAPGCRVYDDGEGVYIANEDPEIEEPIFTAELLAETILNPETGYNSHPKVVAGPYVMTSYDGVTAHFVLNPYFKGAWVDNSLIASEEGNNSMNPEDSDVSGVMEGEHLVMPAIERIAFTLADNNTMCEDLREGRLHLVNKVVYGPTIMECMGMDTSGLWTEAELETAEDVEDDFEVVGDAEADVDVAGDEAGAKEDEEVVAEESSEEESLDALAGAGDDAEAAGAAVEEFAEAAGDDVTAVEGSGADDIAAAGAEDADAAELSGEQNESEDAGDIDRYNIEGTVEMEHDESDNYGIRYQNYPRIGLAFMTFSYDWPTVHEKEVRQAIAWCMDRQALTQAYTQGFGKVVNGYYGIEQWEYLLVTHQIEFPVNFVDDEEHDTDDYKKFQYRYVTTDEEYDAAIAAWEMYTLDNLVEYTVDIEKANALLDDAKWTLNRDGEPYDPEKDDVRCKYVDNELVPLDLTLMYPEGNHIIDTMQENFIDNLNEVGILLTLVPTPMEDLLKSYYRETERTTDMIYLATNFHVIVDPSITYSTDDTVGHKVWNNTYSDDEDLYYRAVNMRETDPGDVYDYVGKWIAFQERYNEVLPTIPIYSNIYFDFYTSMLQGYHITAHVTWSQAILESYWGLEEETTAAEEETDEDDDGFEIDDGLVEFDDGDLMEFDD